MTIRRSYLSALALCTVVLGPASAKTIGEIISQGSSSITGDVYSQGTRAQNGPWTGDIYSQGMMMPNGQIYSQGMEITWQDAEPGPEFGNPNLSPPSNTGNTGGNQSSDNSFSPLGDDPVSLAIDAFTNNAGSNPPAGGNSGGNPDPGGNPNPGGNFSVWTDFSNNDGGDGSPGAYGNPGNDGKPGGDDFGPHNPPPPGHIDPVPEPTSLTLFSTAFLGFALLWAVLPARRQKLPGEAQEVSASVL